MSHEPEVELTNALRRLRPASGIDTGSLLFRAGQASRDRAVRWWRRLALVGVTTSVLGWSGLGWLYFQSPSITPVTAPIMLTHPDPTPATSPTPPAPAADYPTTVPEPVVQSPVVSGELGEYLRVRRDVLANGIGALPEPPVRIQTSPAWPDDLLPSGFGYPYRVRN